MYGWLLGGVVMFFLLPNACLMLQWSFRNLEVAYGQICGYVIYCFFLAPYVGDYQIFFSEMSLE